MPSRSTRWFQKKALTLSDLVAFEGKRVQVTVQRGLDQDLAPRYAREAMGHNGSRAPQCDGA